MFYWHPWAAAVPGVTNHDKPLGWAQDVGLELTFGMILIQLVGCLLPVLNLVLERGDQTLHQSTVGETGMHKLKDSLSQNYSFHIHKFTRVCKGPCDVNFVNRWCTRIQCGHSHTSNLLWPCGSVNPALHHPLVCGLLFWSLEFSIMAITILILWSQKCPYLDERERERIRTATPLVWLDRTENLRTCCSSEKVAML